MINESYKNYLVNELQMNDDNNKSKKKKSRKKKESTIHKHFPLRSQSLDNHNPEDNSCISKIILSKTKRKNTKKKSEKINIDGLINVNNLFNKIVDE